MGNNLRGNLILHVIKIRYIKFFVEKIAFSSMLQRQGLISSKILGDVSFAATKIKQHQKIARSFSGVAKRCHPVAQGWHVPPHTTPYCVGQCFPAWWEGVENYPVRGTF